MTWIAFGASGVLLIGACTSIILWWLVVYPAARLAYDRERQTAEALAVMQAKLTQWIGHARTLARYCEPSRPWRGDGETAFRCCGENPPNHHANCPLGAALPYVAVGYCDSVRVLTTRPQATAADAAAAIERALREELTTTLAALDGKG